MEAIKLWKIIDNEKPQCINRASLNYEARLENWIEKDISIISDNIIVIGTQVQTSYGKKIDF